MSARYEFTVSSGPSGGICRVVRLTDHVEPARTPIARLLRRTVAVTRRQVVGHYMLSELDMSIGSRLNGPGKLWLRLEGTDAVSAALGLR